jgi:triosephosphate isomerase
MIPPDENTQTSDGRRIPLIAGNWKMYKNEAQARGFVDELLVLLGDAAPGRAEVGVCVPFTDLRGAVRSAAGSSLRVYAQNMHQEPEGPFTGEIAAGMLTEIGVHGVVLGHSERRALFGETDQALALKVPAALDAGLSPILCVGETDDERAAGETEPTLRYQLAEDLREVDDEELAAVVIAYEPVWAIGTGNVATPDQAQQACAYIRGLIAARDVRAAERVRVIYGGSVKPENAAELLALADVDGALVGGASLQPGSFMAIVRAAAPDAAQ